MRKFLRGSCLVGVVCSYLRNGFFSFLLNFFFFFLIFSLFFLSKKIFSDLA